jgi:Uncharacterized alpha/beta hydrolase domain (DUF2235)
MASGRNLIVLSDGTGNSASAAFKTNVWRLYQAVEPMERKSPCLAMASVIRALSFIYILGLAFGIGV